MDPSKSSYIYYSKDNWLCIQFDNMSEPRHRKLTAMAYASLVSTGRPEVLQRLPSEIFNLWMDVFGEIQEAYDQATVEGSRSVYSKSAHAVTCCP